MKKIFYETATNKQREEMLLKIIKEANQEQKDMFEKPKKLNIKAINEEKEKRVIKYLD